MRVDLKHRCRLLPCPPHPPPHPLLSPGSRKSGVWPYASFLFALATVSCWVEQDGSVVQN